MKLLLVEVRKYQGRSRGFGIGEHLAAEHYYLLLTKIYPVVMTVANATMIECKLIHLHKFELNPRMTSMLLILVFHAAAVGTRLYELRLW